MSYGGNHPAYNPNLGGYGQAPKQGAYAGQAPQGYGAPPPHQGYGAPAPHQGYGAPPPYQGHGAPPPQHGYATPQQGYGAPQQGYGGGGGGAGGRPGDPGLPPPGADATLWYWFKAVDADGSHQITATELQHALVNGNWSTFNEETCRLMIGMFDRDKPGPVLKLGKPSKELSLFQDQTGKLTELLQSDDLLLLKAVDVDNSGSITVNELQQALINGNWSHFNDETCRLMIGMFDVDKNGTIDFSEFSALWKYIQEWKQCFDRFDKDRSGNIDAQELHDAFVTFGYNLSMNFCHLIMKKFDRTEVNSIKFDDFIQCCVMLRSLTESFKRKDTNRSGNIRIHYEEFLEMVLENSVV